MIGETETSIRFVYSGNPAKYSHKNEVSLKEMNVASTVLSGHAYGFPHGATEGKIEREVKRMLLKLELHIVQSDQLTLPFHILCCTL